MVPVTVLALPLGSRYPTTAPSSPGHVPGKLRDTHPQPLRHVQARPFECRVYARPRSRNLFLLTERSESRPYSKGQRSERPQTSLKQPMAARVASCG